MKYRKLPNISLDGLIHGGGGEGLIYGGLIHGPHLRLMVRKHAVYC